MRRPRLNQASQQALARRLGLREAVVIGLGSMIGAGVFSAFAPAAGAAGTALLLGLAIAAVVAFCNATSSAQLAATYPTSGGTYVYGREQLGPWWGFVAGWGFVVGKTASCAAMALTFAAYAAPAGWTKPVALAAVVALVAINYRGVHKTAAATGVLVAIVLVVLAIVVSVCFAAPRGTGPTIPTDPHGVLQSAGFLFFAFAGYARIATMGEEIREPRRTIPRAIVVALAITVVIYFAVATSLLHVLSAGGLASATAPLNEAARLADAGWANPLVRVGATAASLGALLALIAGVSRTMLAMSREHDLPAWLGAVHPRFRVPHYAELTLGVVVCVLVLSVDLRGAIGFSSFGVLTYYLVANLAALTQGRADRRYPRVLQLLGILGCIVLAFALPETAIIAGMAVIGVGVAFRAVRLATRSRPR